MAPSATSRRQNAIRIAIVVMVAGMFLFGGLVGLANWLTS